ncbi:hypothetical protein HY967_01745 [Candidatus Jorgensenbacteria bacterium]|nr:hypothetical protein [Candidatus Jorgensenbacteria bacterium]
MRKLKLIGGMVVVIVLSAIYYFANQSNVELQQKTISSEDCVTQGGEVVNTLNGPRQNYSSDQFLGEVAGLRCPCICLKSVVFDPKNTAYEIEGRIFTLINGVSEVEAVPGSASKITTRYFGNEATGDLNGDGMTDTAFLITQDGGGSGTFYYAVAVLKTQNGYKTTNAFFIGDRIAPQSTEINVSAMELHVNYAERKPGEPMTVQPSLGAVKLLKVTPEGKLTGLMQ